MSASKSSILVLFFIGLGGGGGEREKFSTMNFCRCGSHIILSNTQANLLPPYHSLQSSLSASWLQRSPSL